MNSISCPHCGQPHPAGATFCTNTGRPLSAAPSPQAPVLQPQYAQPQPQYAQPQPQYAQPQPQYAQPQYAQPQYAPQPQPHHHAQPQPPYAQQPYAQPAAGSSVRHSYPLAIREASFSTAFGLLMKTLPYALARFGILLAVSIVTLIWYVVAFGGWAILGRNIHPGVGFGWFLTCCGVYGWVWWLVVRYFLYLLKCGHIAVLTELITKGQINDGGQGMFAYGKDVVKSRFGEVNVLFAVDSLVSGVLHSFNRTLDFITNLLPIPGLSQLAGFVKAVIYAATTYLDETIFSYGLARQETNPWASAKDGLIYYAQNSKEILKTGVWIVVLDKVLTGIVWLVMLAPAFVIAAILPKSMVAVGFWFVFGFAALLAGNVRAAFLKPLFLVMVMTKFHVQIQNQPINQEWDERLSQASNKFRELTGKIAGYRPAPAALARAV
jgi:hypothetical protein